jgi:hypothetical protein
MDILDHLQLYLFKLPIEGQLLVLALIGALIFAVIGTIILYALFGILDLAWFLIKLPFQKLFKSKEN